MKRLIAFFLAILVIFSFPMSVFAKQLDFMDFSDFGIQSIVCKTTNKTPIQDGNISPNEYGNGQSHGYQSGLVIANKNDEPLNDKTKNLNPKQESFLALDGEYVYCGLRLKLDTNETGGVYKKNLGNVYPITFSLSLSPGDHPANRCSFWSNTYYFSADNGTCAGVSGDRIARSVEKDSVLSLSISNLTEIHRKNGFVDRKGVKWSADHYCENVAFSLSKGIANTSLTVEIVVPIGDLLLSVPEGERSLVAEKMKNQNMFCGSFLSKVGIFPNGDQVILGVSTRDPYPFSQEWDSIKAYVDANYQVPKSGAFPLDFLPIPLYFFDMKQAFPKLEGNSAVKEPNSAGMSGVAEAPEKNPSLGTVSKTSKKTASEIIGVTEKENEKLVSENTHTEDESIFDSLPEAGERLPENTEIVYLSKSEKATSEKKGSLLGSVLTTLAGVFLFAAMIVLVFFVREHKETDEKEQGKQKKEKKDKKR